MRTLPALVSELTALDFSDDANWRERFRLVQLLSQVVEHVVWHNMHVDCLDVIDSHLDELEIATTVSEAQASERAEALRDGVVASLGATTEGAAEPRRQVPTRDGLLRRIESTKQILAARGG
jgi:hypothetical protein